MEAPDILTPPEGDISVQMLDRIFGEGWHTYVTGATPDGSATVLFAMFQTFNAIVLAGVMVMVFYVFTRGAMGTSNEGTPLGKQYDTMLTPLQSVLGVTLLAPLPGGGGLSVLQALILAFVYFGSGAASSLYTSALDYMVDNGGGFSHSATRDDIQPVLDGVLQSAVTQHFMVHHSDHEAPASWFNTRWQSFSETDRRRDRIERELDNSSSTDQPGGGFGSRRWTYSDADAPGAERVDETLGNLLTTIDADADSSYEPGRYVITFPPPADSSISQSAMGFVEIHCRDRLSPLCQARLNGVVNIISGIHELAGQITRNYAEIDVETDGPDAVDEAFVELNQRVYADSVAAYNTAVGDSIRPTMSAFAPRLEAQLQGFAERASEMGWMSAMSFYWSFSRFNQQAIEFVGDGPAYIEPDAQAISTYVDVENLNIYLSKAHSSAEHGKSDVWFRENASGYSDVLDKDDNRRLQRARDWFDVNVKSRIIGTLGTPRDWLFERLTQSSQNVVMSLQSFGGLIFSIAVTVAGLAFALLTMREGVEETREAAGSVPLFGWLARGAVGIASSPMISGAKLLVPAMLAIAVVLVMFASFLYYYLPLIPFILFFMAVVGWIFLVLESLVAAPLWAASHAVPDNNRIASMGQQGWMLFAGVLFRPSLMIIGFFISFVLFDVLARILGEGLMLFATFTRPQGMFIQIIDTFAFMLILVVMTIMLAHRVFGLITYFPDNVMNWVGQQIHSLGEDNDEGRARGMIAAVYSRGESGMSRAASVAGGSSQEPGDDENGGKPGGREQNGFASRAESAAMEPGTKQARPSGPAR